MQMRPEPNPEELVSIQSIPPCQIEIVIDVVALGLSALGIKGGAPKRVGRKMWEKLPRRSKDKILVIIPEMNMSNFPQKILDILQLIYENLTWNALKDSFSELGWFDAVLFALSFAAIFVTAGAAFLINVALLAIDFSLLLIAINNCF